MPISASMAGRMPKKNWRKVILLLKAMTRFCRLPMDLGRRAGADIGAGGERELEGMAAGTETSHHGHDDERSGSGTSSCIQQPLRQVLAGCYPRVVCHALTKTS
jgi:hypothetical protein